jgi:hypothetical protein
MSVVATHPRSYDKGNRYTIDAHRPPNHRAEAETDLCEWSKRFSPEVQLLAEVEMQTSRRPMHILQRVKWVKDLARFHTDRRFEAACKRAVELCDLRFEHVENVLKRGIENAPPQPRGSASRTPQKNIRGADYFRDRGFAHG